MLLDLKEQLLTKNRYNQNTAWMLYLPKFVNRDNVDFFTSPDLMNTNLTEFLSGLKTMNEAPSETSLEDTVAGELLHRFNSSDILDSPEIQNEYIYESLKQGRVFEEAQNLVFQSRSGYRETDVCGSLAYTINNSYKHFDVTLLKPDIDEIATRAALELQSEEGRELLMIARMLWVGELVNWFKRYKRNSCALCDIDKPRMHLPLMDYILSASGNFSKLEIEEKLMSEKIIESALLAKSKGISSIKIVLPHNKIPATLRNLYNSISSDQEVIEKEQYIQNYEERVSKLEKTQLNPQQLEIFSIIIGLLSQSFDIRKDEWKLPKHQIRQVSRMSSMIQQSFQIQELVGDDIATVANKYECFSNLAFKDFEKINKLLKY